jgi:hypothetical protein
MTKAEIERAWADISERRQRILDRLIAKKAIPHVDLSGFNRSDDNQPVGTAAEATELQRGEVRFTAPTSRKQLRDNLLS